MLDQRPNPDVLLKQLAIKDSTYHKRGKLKIFFGYAAGVGKTYAMLEAAHEAKKAGIDVVIGYVEPHVRPQTLALIEGLENIPTLSLPYKDILLKEFDIDAAIKRRPKLILVDELAHTNAKGSRHLKRYQDVEELLQAGIDVYTTINVQHIESLHDIVQSITGIAVRERIPDSVFNRADQIELMDIEPDDLIERLNKGKIYKNLQAQRALLNFFTRENLIALRELSLRRTADRVNIAVNENKTVSQNNAYYTGEHILLCLSSSPSNAKVVRTAARMAEAFRCPFTALYVEMSSFSEMSEKDVTKLSENIKLAEQLGAKIATVYGDDVPQLVSEYAKVSGISKIVIGRPVNHLIRWLSQNFVDKLSTLAPDLEIYVIPNKMTTHAKKKSVKLKNFKLTAPDSLKALSILILSTLMGFWFDGLNFSDANIITVYILGVLFTAVVTDGKIYSGISSVLAVLMFNYFFTDPRLTLQTYNSGYPLTFLVMFISAFLTSTLTKRSKIQTHQTTLKAYRTEILLETSQKLQRATNRAHILHDFTNQIHKLTDTTVILYPVQDHNFEQPIVVPSHTDSRPYLVADEVAVAQWVYRNNKHAGATTNTLPGAKCLYMAVRSNDIVFAVVAVVMSKNKKMDAFEKNLLVAMLTEGALALEKQAMLETNTQISMQAEQEQLRSNLLRAISHDLRTPLTGISGNASILMSNPTDLDEEKKYRLYEDIYDDSIWLIKLIENLLSISRIDNGSIAIKMELELIEDVLTEALKHISRKSIDHHIHVEIKDEMLMAKMDAQLISQVIINIVDNAIKYTPTGSTIILSAIEKENMVEISISDDGDGIADTDKERLFEMFYTNDTKSADSRRGLGIGLALCKSIITAHGGMISVTDNHPTGTLIRFTLQAKNQPFGHTHVFHN